MSDIGKNLATLLGGSYVNRFSLLGRSYKVIPQVDDASRLDTSKFSQYYIRTASGGQVPLSSLVKIENSVEPSKRTQFQQLNSLTISAMMTPGVALGDAMAYLEQEAKASIPQKLPMGLYWRLQGNTPNKAAPWSCHLFYVLAGYLLGVGSPV